MAGVKRGDVLKEMNVYAGRVDVEQVWVDELWFHPDGHPLHHPRVKEPADEKLVANIMQNGIRKAALVRLGYHGDKRVLEVCYGSRRYNAGIVAQERLQKAKDQTVLKFDEVTGKWRLRIKVEFMPPNTTDAEFLVLRQAEDHDPLKKDHNVTVLSTSIIQMNALEVPVDRIKSLLPQGWTKKHISAVCTFPPLSKPLAKRFDDESEETRAPIGLLPAVLEAAPGLREQLLNDLMAAGMKSPMTATKFIQAQARAVANGELPAPVAGPEANPDLGVPDVDRDGLDNLPSDPPLPKTDGPAPKTSANGKGRLKLNVSVRGDTVKKISKQAAQQPKFPLDAQAFFLGAEGSLGEREALDDLLKRAECLGTQAQHMVAGMAWRLLGSLPAKLQKIVHGSVIEAIENAATKPPKAEKPAKEKKADKK